MKIENHDNNFRRKSVIHVGLLLGEPYEKYSKNARGWNPLDRAP